MAKTRDIGPYYWHTLVYPVKPKDLWEKAETQEIDEPYRGGSGYAIRLPLTRLAVVIGKWTAKYTEAVALTRAVAGRDMLESEVNWDKVRFGADEDDF